MIPPIIHRYWEGPPHPLETIVRTVVADVYAGFDLIDHGPDEFDFTGIDGQVIDADRVRHHSNIARYAVLYEHGGIWLDHDVIPIRPLPTDRSGTAVLHDQREGCVLAFTRRHPALAALIAAVNVSKTLGGRSADVSGARLLDVMCDPWEDIDRYPLPHDARNEPTGVMDPYFVHLWDTSTARYQKVE